MDNFFLGFIIGVFCATGMAIYIDNQEHKSELEYEKTKDAILLFMLDAAYTKLENIQEPKDTICLDSIVKN